MTTVGETMRVNAALRREDARDSDLVLLDDLKRRVDEAEAEGSGPLYDGGSCAVLELARQRAGRAPGPRVMSQDEFDRRFSALPGHETFAEILRIPNVVLCGGSVFQLLRGDGHIGSSDLDFYVVGMDPGDEGALWRKAAEFLGAVGRCEHHYDGDSAVRLTKTVITVGSSGVSPSLQLVLRVYPTVASVIQAFDVDSCCMAYDGRRTYLTEAAARSVVTRSLILDPSRRSPTYESRLIKYMGRGMALVLPHLQMTDALEDDVVRMPRLEFSVDEVSGNAAVVGEIRPSDASAPRSDYDLLHGFDNTACAGLDEAVCMHCLHAFSSGKDSYCRVLSLEEAPGALEKIAAAGGMRVGDFLPLEYVTDYHYRFKARNPRLSARDKGKIDHMCRYLGLSRAGELRLIEAINLHGTVSVEPLLDELSRRSEERHGLVRDDRVEMWIKANPGRQFWTASNNPAFEEPKEYYGEWYVESPAPNADPVDEGGCEIGDDSDVCMICHEVIGPGETLNVATLRCGHKMHISPIRRKCCGGLKWMAMHGSCPMCRHGIRDARGGKEKRVLPGRRAAREVGSEIMFADGE